MKANQPQILLVDDDPVLPIVLEDMFSKRNYLVERAHNVAAAREKILSFKPDLCLLDLKMPGESGLKLIPELKKLNPQMRIVVLTGHASIETAVEAIKLGATYYLEKPAQADDILAAFEKDSYPQEQNLDAPEDLFEREKKYIKEALEKNHFNISITAQALGIHRRTLQRKMKKFGLSS